MLLHGETYLERLWRPGNVFRGLPESKAGFDFTLGYDHLVDYNHNYHQNYHHNHIPSIVMIMIKKNLGPVNDQNDQCHHHDHLDPQS